MTAEPRRHISREDYLAGERSGDAKHEYVQGVISALAGGSARHNLIAGNLYANLNYQFRTRGCHVYSSDMRVSLPRVGVYTYPDVSALCGSPQFEDAGEDTLVNPTVIIEVLSPSTESYDRGKKFQRYRTLESLREYILIAQDSYHVDHYQRKDAFQWILTEVDGAEGVLVLASLSLQVPLAEIYAKVSVEDEI